MQTEFLIIIICYKSWKRVQREPKRKKEKKNENKIERTDNKQSKPELIGFCVIFALGNYL